jgi:hypothetical protein
MTFCKVGPFLMFILTGLLIYDFIFPPDYFSNFVVLLRVVRVI